MESEMDSPRGKGKSDQEIEQFILSVVFLIVAVVFIVPVVIAMIMVAALHALKKEQYSLYVGIAGVVVLFWQGITGNLLCYFAIFKHIPYIERVFEKVSHKPIEMNISSYLVTFGLSMVFCYGLAIFTKLYWKKPIISKQEQIQKKKSSAPYRIFRDNREKFLSKQQLKYRQSNSKEVFIGYTDFKERVTVPERDFNYHMLAVGGTGTGKTTLIGSVMEGALRGNKPIIFVDGKGERKSMLEFKQFCEAYGKKVYMFSENDSYTYNPIKHGTPTEIRDKLMNLFEWSEPFYKNFSSLYLQRIVQLIDAAEKERDMNLVYQLLSKEGAKSFFEAFEVTKMKRMPRESKKGSKKKKGSADIDPLASLFDAQLPDEEMEETPIEYEEVSYSELPPELETLYEKFKMDYWDNEDAQRNITGLKNQLGELIESDLGHLFTSSDHEIDLRSITDEGNVVIFSISGNRYRDYIKKLGKIIILDINSLVAYRQDKGRKPTLAIYDEFSAYGNGEIVDIVNKSRSAGFECIISTQTLADIDAVEPLLTNRIISNCNILATGRVNDPDDAEKLAKAFGTFSDSEITSQIERKNNLLKLTSERGTVRTTEAFIAHPKEIKALQIGEIFFARKMKEEQPGINYTRRVYVRNALDKEAMKQIEKIEAEKIQKQQPKQPIIKEWRGDLD